MKYPWKFICMRCYTQGPPSSEWQCELCYGLIERLPASQTRWTYPQCRSRVDAGPTWGVPTPGGKR